MEFNVNGPIEKFVGHIADTFSNNATKQEAVLNSAVQKMYSDMLDGAELNWDTLKELRELIQSTEATINNLDSTFATDAELQSKIDEANVAWDVMDTTFRTVLTNAVNRDDMNTTIQTKLAEWKAYGDTKKAEVLAAYGNTFNLMASGLPKSWISNSNMTLPKYTFAGVQHKMLIESSELYSVVVLDNPTGINIHGLSQLEAGKWELNFTVPLAENGNEVELTLRCTASGGERKDVAITIPTVNAEGPSPAFDFVYGSKSRTANKVFSFKYKGSERIVVPKQWFIDEVKTVSTDEIAQYDYLPVPEDPYAYPTNFYIGFRNEDATQFTLMEWIYDNQIDLRPHMLSSIGRIAGYETKPLVIDMESAMDELGIDTGDDATYNSFTTNHARIAFDVRYTYKHASGHQARKARFDIYGYRAGANRQHELFDYYDAYEIPGLLDAQVGEIIDEDWVVIHKTSGHIAAIPKTLQETTPMKCGFTNANVDFDTWSTRSELHEVTSRFTHHIKFQGGSLDKTTSDLANWLLSDSYHILQLDDMSALSNLFNTAASGTPLANLRDEMVTVDQPFALGGFQRNTSGTLTAWNVLYPWGGSVDNSLVDGSSVAIPVPVRIFEI